MLDPIDGIRPTLLVLASTYPRWHGDPEPGFVHELAKRLLNHFEVIALVPSAPGALAKEKLDGVEVIRFRYAPRKFETLVNDGGIVANLRRSPWKFLLVPAFTFAQIWRAWWILRRRCVHVVHAHWLLPQGLIMACIDGLPGKSPPYLLTSHGADLFSLKGRVLNFLKCRSIDHAAAVTVVSTAMQEKLAQMKSVDLSKVTVQSMGVDLSERFTTDDKMRRSRNEILFVGRFVEKKGLRYLIDAMPAILASHPGAYLTVAGFGPEEVERKSQIQRLGLEAKVRFVGPISQADLPALYRRAAVFVAPFVESSLGDQEGLGLVVVEAIGCGCPVVVSDLPAMREIFGDDLSRLIPPGSASDIAKAVLSIFEGEATGNETQPRERLSSKFDWPVVSLNYARLLRHILNTSSR